MRALPTPNPHTLVSRGARNGATWVDMGPWPRRARITAAFIVVGPCLAVACAADPGDALKGDGGGVVVTMGDAGGPPSDAAGTHDSFAPPPMEAGGVDGTTPPMETGTVDAVPTAAGGPDAPPEANPCTTGCPYTVEYMTPTTTAMSTTMAPTIEIMNNTANDQDLTKFTVRYWFTADGSSSLAFACDYAGQMLMTSQVMGTFVTMSTPTMTADTYLEVSFTAGTLGEGTTVGPLQMRAHDTSYATTFNQANDYSFNAMDTAFTQSTQITLYMNGGLVWGTEP